MEKKIKKTTILTGTVIAGALLTFSVNAEARPSTQVLGNGAELRSEIIDLNVNSSSDKLFELKCGEKSGAATKKAEAKPDAKKAKTSEAKCGEGKCGESGKKAEAKKDTKAAKAAKTEKKEKTSEAKCGEGKCGAE